MQALLAVFLDDLRRRRMVFAFAAGLGLVAALLPLAAGIRHLSAQDLRHAGVLAFLTAFFLLVPPILGASLFAAEQAGGRLGFYLSRPLHPWQLLWGRIGSVLAACGLGGFLIVMPSRLLGVGFSLTESCEVVLEFFFSFRHESGLAAAFFFPPSFAWPIELTFPQALFQSFLGLSVGIALGHAAGVFVRLGGRWSLFDFFAALWVGKLALGVHFHFLSLRAEVSVWPVFALGFLASALAGLWLQIRRGGTSVTRLHGIFSLALWVPLLVLGLSLELWAEHLEDRGPTELETVSEVMSSSSGETLLVGGHLGTHPAAFVFDLDAATWSFFDSVSAGYPPFFVGEDLFWTRCIVHGSRPTPENTTCRLLSLRHVEAADPQSARDLRHLPVDLGVVLGDNHPSLFDVHPDGERVAFYRGRAVHEASWPGGKILHSAPLPKPWFIRYDEGDELRVGLRFREPGDDHHPNVVLAFDEGELREVEMSDAEAEWIRQGQATEPAAEPVRWTFDADEKCLAREDGPTYCFGGFSGPS